MKCPFCQEDIQDGAKKCKHCNEWLDGRDTGKKWQEDGSAAARGVAKGIKQKELADFSMTLMGTIALIFSLLLGYAFHSFWVGFGIFIVCMIPITKKYYRE